MSEASQLDTLTGNNVAPPPEVTERDVQKLFGATHNDEYFQKLFEQPGDEYILELTAVFYLRSSFSGGVEPPSKMPADEPLRSRILSLDPQTIQDPVQQQVFVGLQAAMNTDTDDPSSQTEQMLAAQLVPCLIKKHEPNAANKILEAFQGSIIGQRLTPDAADIYAGIQAAANEVVESSRGSGVEPFSRLRLAAHAEQAGEAFMRHAEEFEPDMLKPERLAASTDALKRTRRKLLSTEYGMSDDSIGTVEEIVAHTNLGRSLFGEEEQFTRLTDCLKTGGAQELVRNITPKFKENPDLTQIVLTRALESDDSASTLQLLNETFGSAEFEDAMRVVGNVGAVHRSLISRVLGSEEPQAAFRQIKTALDAGAIVGLKKRLDPEKPSQAHIWQQIASALVYDPEATQGLIENVAATPRLRRMLEEPSQALPQFLDAMKISDPEMLVRGAAGAIAENYAQASKLTDRLQIMHYEGRVAALTADIAAISYDPQTSELYKAYLDKNGNMPAKDEIRAAKLYRTVQILGVAGEVSEVASLDDLEASLIDGFVSKLSGEERKLSQIEKERLVDQLGNIAPLLTYGQKHMAKGEFRQALAELTQSVADGSYSVWHRGDGSQEAMQAMVEAGYLPTGLTLAQYQEWISDRDSDSQEQLVASAEGLAETIRSAVALGSVDVALLATGYAFDKENLETVVNERNNLGRLLGTINKVAQNYTGALDEAGIQEIEEKIGETAGGGETAKILAATREGFTTEEIIERIKTQREHLNQLQLLIRIANIDTEEVAAGALLKEPAKDGSRKVQHKLSDVLDTLIEELPPELRFIPQTVQTLLDSAAQEDGRPELLTAEDTINPRVTLEIGETPQRSCQHYETGQYNEGLIGYFGPDVKILLLRNAKGGIIARSILRLMEDDQGEPVLYTEPVYQSIASPQVRQMLEKHAADKALRMGIDLRGSLGAPSNTTKELKVRALKMPAVYSDGAVGTVHRDSLAIRA